MINLYVIGNEKIYSNKKNFYCPNIDFKTIVEGLHKYFKVILIARFCSQKQIFKINHNKIFVSPNIISYIRCVVLSFKNLKSNKYLIISITHYTFCAFLILQFFSNKIYLYLRSDGHKEYERILGKQWAFLYSFMYFFFLKRAKIISCGKELVQNKKFFLVNPSELDEYWFKNQKNIFYYKKIKLIYVGRIRIYKGIFNWIYVSQETSSVRYISPYTLITNVRSSSPCNLNTGNCVVCISHLTLVSCGCEVD